LTQAIPGWGVSCASPGTSQRDKSRIATIRRQPFVIAHLQLFAHYTEKQTSKAQWNQRISEIFPSGGSCKSCYPVGMKKDLSTRTLGLIHSAASTAVTVQPFLDEIMPEVQVLHFADDSIQRAAEAGALSRTNYFKFTTYAHFLEQAGADLILLTCSTFSRAVELAAPMIDAPLLQIDRPMMDLAVKTGTKIGLLATLACTVPSSERLLRLAAREAGKEIEIQTVVCSEAFPELRRGNREKHNELLLAEIERLSAAVDCICLAQVSMSVLESRLVNPKVSVFNSARTGFTRAREILRSTDRPGGC
jgi:aspartate/glutamate racemase